LPVTNRTLYLLDAARQAAECEPPRLLFALIGRESWDTPLDASYRLVGALSAIALCHRQLVREFTAEHQINFEL